MAIKLRTVIKHPSRVEGGAGLSVTKTNGVVNVALDFESLSATSSIADQSATTVLLVTPAVGSAPEVVERMEVDDFLALAVTFDAELAAIAGLSSAPNKLPYFTGVGTAALTDFTSLGRANVALSSLTANGVLYGNGASAIAATAAGNDVQILRGSSGGAPSWTVAPLLGTAGVGTGKITFGGTTSGAVTVQPQDAAGTYNFNLPTSAGSSGQPLLSAGGGSSPMTFGTVGVAAGGTGATSAPAALANLGVSAFAQTILDDTTAAAALTTLGISAFAQTILDDASAAAVLTTLGVSSFAQTLLDDASASAARTTLGLAIGADVQAFNARLADIAGLSFAQGDILYHNGSNIVKLAAGTNGHFLRTQGPGANPAWTSVGGGGDLLAANNLSDVASVPAARENLRIAGATVRVATTANVNLSNGLENGDIIDGVTLATGDLVLVWKQSTAADNGIYTVVASGAASRSTGFTTYNAYVGLVVSVNEGTLYVDRLFLGTANRGGTISVTSITFSDLTAPSATTSTPGIVELATTTEVRTGRIQQSGYARGPGAASSRVHGNTCRRHGNKLSNPQRERWRGFVQFEYSGLWRIIRLEHRWATSSRRAG